MSKKGVLARLGPKRGSSRGSIESHRFGEHTGGPTVTVNLGGTSRKRKVSDTGAFVVSRQNLPIKRTRLAMDEGLIDDEGVNYDEEEQEEELEESPWEEVDIPEFDGDEYGDDVDETQPRIRPNVTFLERVMKCADRLNTDRTFLESMASGVDDDDLLPDSSIPIEPRKYLSSSAQLSQRQDEYMQGMHQLQYKVGVTLINRIANEFGIRVAILGLADPSKDRATTKDLVATPRSAPKASAPVVSRVVPSPTTGSKPVVTNPANLQVKPRTVGTPVGFQTVPTLKTPVPAASVSSSNFKIVRRSVTPSQTPGVQVSVKSTAATTPLPRKIISLKSSGSMTVPTTATPRSATTTTTASPCITPAVKSSDTVKPRIIRVSGEPPSDPSPKKLVVSVDSRQGRMVRPSRIGTLFQQAIADLGS